MKLYGGIDLHSNNCVISLLDEKDNVIYNKKLPNELDVILNELCPFHSRIEALAVESTYNWYWLVDGLMDNGYSIHLMNTTAVQTYSGLKYTNDSHDARWLAHLLRLDILPTGYIYPKTDRGTRDLLRKRMQMVRQSTMNLLSIQNLYSRNTGQSISANDIKRFVIDDIEKLPLGEDQRMAIFCNFLVMQQCRQQASRLEKNIKQRVRLRPEFNLLLGAPGIGYILALTIMLETGDISRFTKVGNFVSYARCVSSKKISNGKKKGENNRKNGNKYLAWAFMEAANFAIRYNDHIKGYYQKKSAKTKRVIALKAVAHKMARACYYVMRNQEPFDISKAFLPGG